MVIYFWIYSFISLIPLPKLANNIKTALIEHQTLKKCISVIKGGVSDSNPIHFLFNSVHVSSWSASFLFCKLACKHSGMTVSCLQHPMNDGVLGNWRVSDCGHLTLKVFFHRTDTLPFLFNVSIHT